MPVFDLSKLTAGLSRPWAGYLRDWDRCLRAANHPQTTRYNYLLAAVQRRAGGDTGDLMLLLGWSSEDMPRHYGASAAAERAQEAHQRLGVGERV
jgi:hypothetical protein